MAAYVSHSTRTPHAHPARTRRQVVWGSAALLATTTAMTRWLVSVVADLAGRGWGELSARPADVLVLGCAAGALAVTGRWLIGAGLTAASLLPGALGRAAGSLHRKIAPRLLVRWTTAALGGTVAMGLPYAAAVAASTRVAGPPRPAAVVGSADAWRQTPDAPRAGSQDLPDPGWRNPASSAPSATPVTPVTSATPVTVRSGDTLWELAAARLPGRPPNAAIDRAWRAWYAANQGTIGPNPHLIHPGQRLLPPAARRTATASAAEVTR